MIRTCYCPSNKRKREKRHVAWGKCTDVLLILIQNQLLALTWVISIFLFWKMRDLDQAGCKLLLNVVLWT